MQISYPKNDTKKAACWRLVCRSGQGVCLVQTLVLLPLKTDVTSCDPVKFVGDRPRSKPLQNDHHVDLSGNDTRDLVEALGSTYPATTEVCSRSRDRNHGSLQLLNKGLLGKDFPLESMDWDRINDVDDDPSPHPSVEPLDDG